eukprot:7389459-Prymnesium_polylepis.2
MTTADEYALAFHAALAQFTIKAGHVRCIMSRLAACNMCHPQVSPYPQYFCGAPQQAELMAGMQIPHIGSMGNRVRSSVPRSKCFRSNSSPHISARRSRGHIAFSLCSSRR